ncbi:root phototropism protein 3 isoform X1 [Selaginella moellendorffii]|uniref:root phototropism protein 3 isoform X1 n=1 Tax=Selaginella moellendorffii TaxID=88036 RepID=UPI000D1D1074|nr:root phototropism protein 3 isoform X1 [Selaginella moellendorffii]XP_024531041.1 root phototropism protein 3 isoform X1 [Selaginella moellendorffii]|eukprot:XP_024531040.1 root phototropism protein 3 isoform X1 [Selaginella moellendorffii]
MKRRENVPRQQQQQRIGVYNARISGRACNRVPSNAENVTDEKSNKYLSMSRLKLDEEAAVPAGHNSFQRKGQAWFVATELQSDLVVEVDDLKFHLHKFPLLSRSGRLNRLVFESRDTETDEIKLVGVPGGPEAFELAARFCYGMPIDLNASNVAALRCAAEYLEMVEELEEGNLIAKTEAFLALVVLASWKDTLTVLLSCEKLHPWAEDLQIVRRCSESIAWKACTDPKGLNNWPTITGGKKNFVSPSSYIAKDGRNLALKQVPQDWWFEDVCMLCIDHFTKVLTAIKAKGMKSELVGAVIMCYALKWIPTLSNGCHESSKTGRAVATSSPAIVTKEDFTWLQARSKLVVESMVGLLPGQKNSVSCGFLLQMLRIASMLNASGPCKVELEKRIAIQLEQATLGDLLIPSAPHVSDTRYDVGLVQRLVEYFLAHEEETSPDRSPDAETPSSVDKAKLSFDNKSSSISVLNEHSSGSKMKVAKLLDSYLAEVAHDPQLPLTKFQALADALPVYSRACHDGLYRAIDMYLKAHPTATEQDRKRLCRIMDCQRLSSEARLHASQNERLPLRTVVQVLFSEHLKLKNIYGYGSFGGGGTQVTPPYSEATWETASQDIRSLKKDIEKIKEQFLELRTGYNHIKQDLQKLLKPSKRSSASSSSWGCGLKRLGSTLASPRFFHYSSRDDGPSTPDIFKSRRWR